MSRASGKPPVLVTEGSTSVNVGRLALRKAEAVEALGVSDETFDRYIRPSLPVVRCGSVRLYPVSALQAWLEDQAMAPIDEIERAA
jgi:hypothetical protein